MFKARSASLLATLVLLTACQVPAGPGGAASPKPKPVTAAGAALLRAPATASTVLSGQVEIDAHYLLGTGKGKLLGAAGGNVIAAGGGNLLGAAGGNLLGAAGGNVVAAGGGNLIGKRKFSLAATAATQLGQTMPAAEMEIQIFAMADGKPLSLGVDAQGQAVLSIYTDAAGKFKTYLPPSVTGKNVRVVASVPETRETRLSYQVVTAFDAADAGLISEDTALVAAFLREAFVSRLERLFEQDLNLGREGGGIEDTLPASMAALVTPMLADFKQAVRDGRVASLSETRRKELARRTADVILAHVELGDIAMEKGGGKVLPTMVAVLKEVREGAITRMRADADYFDDQPFLKAANAARAGEPPFEIKKPADLNDLMLQTVLTNSDRSEVSQAIADVLTSVGLPIARRDVINAGMDSLLKTIGLTMLTNAEVKAAAIATIEAGLPN